MSGLGTDGGMWLRINAIDWSAAVKDVPANRFEAFAGGVEHLKGVIVFHAKAIARYFGFVQRHDPVCLAQDFCRIGFLAQQERQQNFDGDQPSGQLRGELVERVSFHDFFSVRCLATATVGRVGEGGHALPGEGAAQGEAA